MEQSRKIHLNGGMNDQDMDKIEPAVCAAGTTALSCAPFASVLLNIITGKQEYAGHAALNVVQVVRS